MSRQGWLMLMIDLADTTQGGCLRDERNGPLSIRLVDKSLNVCRGDSVLSPRVRGILARLLLSRLQ